MKDFFESVVAGVKERVASPLSGAIALSWLACNYKFLLVFFSADWDPNNKVIYITETLYPTLMDCILVGVFWPVVIALAYLLIYPVPVRWIMQYTLWQQHITKIMQVRKSRKRIFTDLEVRRLRRVDLKRIAELEAAAESRETRMLDLKHRVEIGESKVDQLREQLMKSERENVLAEIEHKNKIDELNQAHKSIEWFKAEVQRLNELCLEKDQIIDSAPGPASAVESDIISGRVIGSKRNLPGSLGMPSVGDAYSSTFGVPTIGSAYDSPLGRVMRHLTNPESKGDK